MTAMNFYAANRCASLGDDYRASLLLVLELSYDWCTNQPFYRILKDQSTERKPQYRSIRDAFTKEKKTKVIHTICNISMI